jgi:hypothetical protein
MGHDRNQTINLNEQVDLQPKRGNAGTFSDKYITFSAVLNSMLGFVRWPIKFFTLTEEERLKAGIYTSGEEQDI